MAKNLIWVLSLLILLGALLIQTEMVIIGAIFLCGLIWLGAGLWFRDKRFWIPGIVLLISSVFLYLLFRLYSMMAG